MIKVVESPFLDKGQLMMLDLIAQNNWERPIYFNYTSENAVNFFVTLFARGHGLQVIAC